MITKEDIKSLANLARIELSDEEAQSMTGEIDSILGYVSQIQGVAGDIEKEVPKLRNIMREDEVTHAPREYTEKILQNAPARDGDYLKVKKIL